MADHSLSSSHCAISIQKHKQAGYIGLDRVCQTATNTEKVLSYTL